MGLDSLLCLLGDQVQAPDEETFDLFAQQFPSQDLGFIDSKAKTLELSVAGRDLTIHQSPTILSSSRAGGTTGAVAWKITPLFAEWISSPTNPLFTHEILTSNSSVIELGCGIAGIVGLLVAPQVSNYILTDQIYVAKLLEENLASNKQETRGKSQPKGHNTKQRPSSKQPKSHASSSPPAGGSQIRFHPLDWETDTPTITSLLTSPTTPSKSFDLIIACDCIYNEALVEPFVSTCVEICKFKLQDPDSHTPCICVVALHLRDPSVFEAFITTFTSEFHVWRVPDSLLLEGLRSNSGFVVHMGVLKGTIPDPGTSSGTEENR